MKFVRKILYEVIIIDHESLKSSIIGFSKIPQMSNINDIRNRLITKISSNSSLSITTVNTINKALYLDECLLFLVTNGDNKPIYSVKMKKA